jgi:hypothetical protein
MTLDSVASLAGRNFRAGKAFELVVFDRLPPEEQAFLAEMRADPDFYGILRPHPGTGRTIKSVTRDTALLWLTLQSPGPLPFFVFSGDAEAAVKAVWEFVLDGVLEMEENGSFVAGSEAADLLSNGRRSVTQGRLARLSMLALRYGEKLGFDDPQLLAGWLYQFGRQPVSPFWARRLADSEAVLAFLGAGTGSDLRQRLDADWEIRKDAEAQGWLAWTNRRRGEVGQSKVTHKLYISPQVEEMPDVFATVLGVLSTRSAHFKIGSDAAGLLRPDKMVVYFGDQDSLLEVALELAKQLSSVAPHGVPFSAQITPNGLLSWGMDPPQTEHVLTWQEPESWRQWVVRRLAAAMIAAQSNSHATMTPADFALERLRHEGVDVDDWKPTASIWHTT